MFWSIFFFEKCIMVSAKLRRLSFSPPSYTRDSHKPQKPSSWLGRIQWVDAATCSASCDSIASVSGAWFENSKYRNRRSDCSIFSWNEMRLWGQFRQRYLTYRNVIKRYGMQLILEIIQFFAFGWRDEDDWILVNFPVLQEQPNYIFDGLLINATLALCHLNSNRHFYGRINIF